jgi:hypothetical protein
MNQTRQRKTMKDEATADAVFAIYSKMWKRRKPKTFEDIEALPWLSHEEDAEVKSYLTDEAFADYDPDIKTIIHGSERMIVNGEWTPIDY